MTRMMGENEHFLLPSGALTSEWCSFFHVKHHSDVGVVFIS